MALQQWQGAEVKRSEAEARRDQAAVKKQQADQLWQEAIKKRQQAQVQHNSAEHIVMLASKEGWGSMNDEALDDPYESPEMSETAVGSSEVVQTRGMDFGEVEERETRDARRMMDKGRGKKSLFAWAMNGGMFLIIVGLMRHATMKDGKFKKKTPAA